MKLRHLLVLTVVAALAFGTTVAHSDTFVTGAQVRNETLSAADLGADVTSVKSVTVTIPAQEEPTFTQCNDPARPNACDEYVSTAPGVMHKLVQCPSGNVTSGGVRFEDDEDQANLAANDYPQSDHAWHFALRNDGPDTVTVQLRIVCI